MLDTLIHSPQLVQYYQRVRELLEQESRKRQEFYETMTEQQKVEFINGDVVMQSPVKLEHDFASGRLYMLLDAYVNVHDLGYVGHEKMLISLTRNDYEPDVCYWNSAKADEFAPKQMRFPAPDFIAEILSPSTEGTDRRIKFQDYSAHGVQEYWLIDPDRKMIEQYVLHGEQYELIQKTNSGILDSPVIQGFRIPTAVIFDKTEHLRVLQAILHTA